MYVKRDLDLFIAAISPENRNYPNWYYNIVADPDVTVELFWRKRRYTAVPVNEKPEKLELIRAFPFGMIEAMHQNPAEEIPVIRLKPVGS